MSEALSQGPESLGPHYIGGPVYTSSEPHLTTLTVHSEHPPGPEYHHEALVAHHTHLPAVTKVAASGLPPFSSFGGPEAPTTQFAGNGGPEGLSGRLLDISSWDYYGEGLSGRLLEQRPAGGGHPGGPLGAAIGGGGGDLLGLGPTTHHPQFAPHHQHPAAHQMHPHHHAPPHHHPHHPHHQLLLQQQHPQQYRPWESKGGGAGGEGDLLLLKGSIPTFTDAFGGGAKPLPSFQSQFQGYGPDGLPLEASAQQQQQHQLQQDGSAPSQPPAPGLPSFHTLGPAAAVPPPPQPTGAARYPLVPAPVQAREVPSIQQQFVDERHIHLFHGQPGFGGGPGQYPPPPPPAPSHPPPVVLAKAESSADSEHYPPTGNGPHRSGPRGTSGAAGKFGESRKKERRKARGGAQGPPRADSAESAQVAAVSSTAPVQNHPGRPPGEPPDEGGGAEGAASAEGGSAEGVDKGSKKKRKRCGECVGCARKDNCGGCAPCRNEKSHQICKMRRCEKLTEKKDNFVSSSHQGKARSETSRRGQGRARGGGRGGGATSYRNKVLRAQQQQQQQQQQQVAAPSEAGVGGGSVTPDASGMMSSSVPGATNVVSSPLSYPAADPGGGYYSYSTSYVLNVT